MYMSDIVATAREMDIPWDNFPLDQWTSLNIYWEYGMSYPMGMYFSVGGEGMGDQQDPEDACTDDGGGSDAAHMAAFCMKLWSVGNAVMFMNPSRCSMMLFAVHPRFDKGTHWEQELPVSCSKNRGTSHESCWMDGGDDWAPRMELVHEFSLLTHIEKYDNDMCTHSDSNATGDDLGFGMKGNRFWGGLMDGCSSVTDMQNKLFSLTGFGPYPYPRRASVLLFIEPCEDLEESDNSNRRLGVVVAHRFQVCTVSLDGFLVCMSFTS